MTKKVNFTTEDTKSYDPIESRANASKTSTISNTSIGSNVEEDKKTRKYNKLTLTGDIPEEYRITLKMRGELGMYIAAKAYFNFNMDRDQVVLDLIEEDMKKNPQIMKDLEKLRKKAQEES